MVIKMQTENITELSEKVKNELTLLENLLTKELSKGNTFISKEGVRLLKGGGKRLRPIMTILFAMLGSNYNSDQTLNVAASIETMHMATLIHDDTIDNAESRRGIDTTFAKHGIHTAVYTGDWMFIKSLQFISGSNDETSIKSDLLNMLSQAMETVFEGELDQYYGRGNIPELPIYYSRIKGKTAAMFAASCASGAKLADLSEKQIQTAKDFGDNFGIAFQILDDLLDVESTTEIMGKPVKNDLAEGIVTLPFILACKNSTKFRKLINRFLKNPSHDILNEIRSDKALKEGINLAKDECLKYFNICIADLNKLPEGEANTEIMKVLNKVFISRFK